MLIHKKDIGHLGHLEIFVQFDKAPRLKRIPVLFNADTRNSATYYFEDVPSGTIEGDGGIYPHTNRALITKILDQLQDMLRFYSVDLNPGECERLRVIILGCFLKCDSTYGYGIRDKELYPSDAVIYLCGEFDSHQQ